MGLLGKVFRQPKSEITEEEVPCPHTALVPHWDNAEDMGKADRVTTYLCTACFRTFSREEAEASLIPGR